MVFRLLSVLFATGAMYHALAVALPELRIPGVWWWHILFVIIDAACAWLLLWRPRWFLPVFALLTIQQLYGHGRGAWLCWTVERRVDWLALGVLLVVPLTFVLLAWDARERVGRSAV